MTKGDDRCPEMLVISTLAAVFTLLAEPVYTGIGGQLGIIAAVSVFSDRGYRKILMHLTENRKVESSFHRVGFRTKSATDSVEVTVQNTSYRFTFPCLRSAGNLMMHRRKT